MVLRRVRELRAGRQYPILISVLLALREQDGEQPGRLIRAEGDNRRIAGPYRADTRSMPASRRRSPAAGRVGLLQLWPEDLQGSA